MNWPRGLAISVLALCLAGNERAVSEALYDQYPLLMAKLETIGT